MTKPKKTQRKLPETVLVLRTCQADMTSHGGFVWPKKGVVRCPDWSPEATCGNGLHGFLWGEGEGDLADWSESAVWLVVEVLAKDIVDLGGKVKFPRGRVLFAGSRLEATNLIQSRRRGAIIGATTVSGEGGTSLSGKYGTSTSGDYGTSTSGDFGTSTSGDYGTSTSGDFGTSTSGKYGTSTSGYGGTSTSGYGGTSTSGYRGKAQAGAGGELRIRYFDGARYRLAVAYVGEDGILPNTLYRVTDSGKFEKVL